MRTQRSNRRSMPQRPLAVDRLVRYMPSLISLSFLGLIVQCKNIDDSTTREQETYAVLSVIIENNGGPIPAPPPEGLSDREFKRVSDSIRRSIEPLGLENSKRTVAVYPVPSSLSDPIELDKEYHLEYQNLVDRLMDTSPMGNINITKIKTPKWITLVESPTMDNLRADPRSWDNFDRVLSSSWVSFNEAYSKAAVVLGITYSRSSGYSSLQLLEKVDGAWKIVAKRTLNVS